MLIYVFFLSSASLFSLHNELTAPGSVMDLAGVLFSQVRHLPGSHVRDGPLKFTKFLAWISNTDLASVRV